MGPFQQRSVKETLQAAHGSQENLIGIILPERCSKEGNFTRAYIIGTMEDRGRNWVSRSFFIFLLFSPPKNCYKFCMLLLFGTGKYSLK